MLFKVLIDTLCDTLDNFFQSVFQDTNFSPAVSNLPLNPPTEFLILTIIWLILEFCLFLFQVCLVASNRLLFLSHIAKLPLVFTYILNMLLCSLHLINLISKHFASSYLLALASGALFP